MLSLPTYDEHSALANRVAALEQSQGGNTVKTFGAMGDGVTDDTVSINAALNSGLSYIVFPAGHYMTKQLTIGPDVREIVGQGIIEPIEDETNIFDQSGVSDLTISGLRVKGFPNGVKSSRNDSIQLQNSARVRITNMVFEACPRRPLQIDGGEDITVADNLFDHCANGPAFLGCKRSRMSRNIVNGSIQPDGTFKVGLNIQPYSDIYGLNQYITLDHNIITGLHNSQGILLHTGQDVTIIGNVITGCASGINLNRFNDGDIFERIAITGNTIRGLKVSETSFTPAMEKGINLSGTNTTFRNVSVNGNTIFGVANVLDADPHGGIILQAVESVSVVGNSIDICGNAGIGFFGDASSKILIATNEINMNSGGTPIKESASYTGLITDNLV